MRDMHESLPLPPDVRAYLSAPFATLGEMMEARRKACASIRDRDDTFLVPSGSTVNAAHAALMEWSKAYHGEARHA